MTISEILPLLHSDHMFTVKIQNELEKPTSLIHPQICSQIRKTLRGKSRSNSKLHFSNSRYEKKKKRKLLCNCQRTNNPVILLMILLLNQLSENHHTF